MDCLIYSVAQWFGTYDDHDHKVNDSTPSLVLLFRPWIRCFQIFFFNVSFQVLLIFHYDEAANPVF